MQFTAIGSKVNNRVLSFFLQVYVYLLKITCMNYFDLNYLSPY